MSGTHEDLKSSGKLGTIIDSFILLENAMMFAKAWTSDGNKAHLEARLKHANFSKLRQEVTQISDQKLREIKERYIGSSSVRWFMNQYIYKTSSGESQAVQDASSHLTSDSERANIILDYMCDKKNWHLGFCRFLWDEHLNSQMLKPVAIEERKDAQPSEAKHSQSSPRLFSLASTVSPLDTLSTDRTEASLAAKR